MNRATDALIGTTSTDVASHGGIDLRVRRMCVLGEQRSRCHELAGLAIPTLRHVLGDPSVLEVRCPRCREAFNGCDPFGDDRSCLELA